MWKNIKTTCKTIFSTPVRRKMSINIYKGIVNEGFCFLDDEQGLFRLRFGKLSTTRTVLQYFPAFWDHRYWKKLCHNQNLQLLKWIMDMFLRPVLEIFLSQSLVDGLQEEMQAVLRNRSMNCFQTFPAQLSFLRLKFFKLIRKV